MIKPTAHYLRPRSRICLLYKQERLDRNEELLNFYIDLQKRLSLLLLKYTGLGSMVCCLLQCGFSWARRDWYLQAISFTESADRL